MVGTDFHGHTFPGAVYPFGMVQLSPDTRPRSGDWDGCSGYHYSDSLIYGFSHTHLSGTGCDDLCDVLIMPVCDYKSEELDRELYYSSFSHSREKASVGYYEVYLDGPEVLARLSVGRRSGYHEYVFDSQSVPQLIIDLAHRDRLLDSFIEMRGDNAVAGRRRSSSWAVDQDLYFWMEFSSKIADFKPFGKEGALLTFGGSGKHRRAATIQVRVGISSVSVDNAKANLYSDNCRDVRDAASTSRRAWNEYLGKIDVTGSHGSPEQLSTFYTALYHTAVHPSLYSDVNGEYRGMDGRVHHAEGFERYHVFSLWDTFRALHPLFTLIERERTHDFLRTFQSIYDECGKLPVWELAGNETNCMIGFNSVSVITDALAKGIDCDAESLLDAMVASSKKHEYGLDSFYANGVVLADDEHESVSKTLEYAYDAWCISRVAEMLIRKYPHSAEYKRIYYEYRDYAAYYANAFDASTGFMRARLNGRWQSPFDPREVNNHFTEANSWQYSFFVPQDISGHIRLLGGDAAYCDRLDALFSADDRTSGRTQVDITGLIGQYAHGNEPSHHVAYLYSYAGAPWKTQERVRHIMDTLYSSVPDGLCGNEDCGQMSAWYVLSAVGLYSVTPGSDEMVLGSPLFDRCIINLENGRRFVLEARSAASGALPPYITGAKLNGDTYPQSYLKFDDILAGGILELNMSSIPDKDFGSAKEHRPHSALNTSLVRNPVFEVESDIFSDSVAVRIANKAQGCTVFYSIDKEPFHVYEGEFVIRDDAQLEAYCEDAAWGKSHTVHCSLHKIMTDRTVSIKGHYNPQYSAGGDDALIDGQRGSVNWRTGGWQGYQGEDFEVVVDLLEPRAINSVAAGFCQDARSWIWMPRAVEFYVSVDGEAFEPLVTEFSDVDPQDYTAQTLDIGTECPDGTVARYVKVRATQLGTIPDWHPGAGGQSFIFVDEIMIN